MKYWDEDVEFYSPEELAERDDILGEEAEDRRIIEATEEKDRKGANT